jgi:hypothetical protein
MIQEKKLTYIEIYRETKSGSLQKMEEPQGSSHLKYQVHGCFGRMFLMSRENDLLDWPVRFEPWTISRQQGVSCGKIHLSVGMS